MSAEQKDVLIPIENIHPNRMNPNMMEFEQRLILEPAMKKKEYDALVVSPAHIFYKDFPEMGTEGYIICDGEHRYEEGVKLGHEMLKCDIWHITEQDAMPYFFQRHAARGNIDPIRLAILFKHEMVVNKKTRRQITKDYHLPNMDYITSRLKLLNVAVNTVNFFYEPPEGCTETLSMSHLRELGTIPKRFQKSVAILSLRRGWSRNDLRAECRRIKEGKRTRAFYAFVEAPDIPPPPATAFKDSRDEMSKKFAEAKPEPETKAPLSDEEVLSDYPTDLKGEIPGDDEVKTIAETLPKAKPPCFGSPEGMPAPELNVEDCGEICSDEMIRECIEAYDNRVVEEEVATEADPESEPEPEPEPEPSEETPELMFLQRSDLDELITIVMEKAYLEGLNLNNPDALKLIKEDIDTNIFRILDQNDYSSVPSLIMRAAQLWKVTRDRS